METFKIINGVLREYIGQAEEITIPNSVTRIGRRAFWERSNIKSITIPESVTGIGYLAFDYCSNLLSFK